MQNFNIHQYHLLIQSILGCFSLYFLGLFTGFITAKYLKYNLNRTKFLSAVFSCPHTTSIPLLLIEVTHPVLAKISNIVPADGIMDARSRGMLYIVLNSILSNIWRWTIPYSLINREIEETSLKDVEERLIPEEGNKIPSVKNDKKSSFFEEIINMPIIASISSLGICLMPSVQTYLSTKGSFLNETIMSVNRVTSKGYGFLVMFLLGLNFSELIFPKKDSNEPKQKKIFVTTKDLIFITFMKLFVMPMIASPFIIFLFVYGIVDDDVMIFLFLFMAAAPNAINTIVLCSMKNAYIETVSMIMVVQYVVSVFTLTIQISLIIWFLSIF